MVCFVGFKTPHYLNNKVNIHAKIAFMIGFLFPKWSLIFREDHAIYVQQHLCTDIRESIINMFAQHCVSYFSKLAVFKRFKTSLIFMNSASFAKIEFKRDLCVKNTAFRGVSCRSSIKQGSEQCLDD